MKLARWTGAAVVFLLATGAFAEDAHLAWVLKQLKDKSAAKRVSAAGELVSLKAVEAIPALIEALQDREMLVRYNAAAALSNLGESAKAAAPALKQGLSDKDASVRSIMASALRSMKQPPSEWLPTVVAGTKDSDAEVRKYATDLLADIQKVDLWEAAEAGDAAALGAFVDAGVPVDAKDDGWTALQLSAQKGHTEAVSLLLDKGADVNALNGNGYTPLLLAAMDGQVEVAKVLVAKGADLKAQTTSGVGVLHAAAQGGQAAIVELLLAKGLDANLPSRDGATPVFYAAASGKVEVVRLLVARKARLTSPAGQSTVLHQAAMSGDVPTIEYLLTKGVLVNAKDLRGQTPLARAVEKGHTAAAEALKKRGAK